MHNPFTNYPVGDDWATHRERGSAGGIDYKMPVGTALPACSSGVVLFLPDNGTGGHTATIVRSDGSRTQYMHLSRFDGESGRIVSEGEIVGYSGGAKGAPGAGSSTGPHLHAHDITPAGVRVPPFTTGPKISIAALAAKPLEGDQPMKYLYIFTPALGMVKATKTRAARPAQPALYALINIETLPDGAYVTPDVAEAQDFNRITQQKAIRYDRAAFESVVKTAAKLAAKLVDNTRP